MRVFPTAFSAQKNMLTGASPVWIFKFAAGGVDYYLSDNAFLIGPWSKMTLPWMQSLGKVQAGIDLAVDTRYRRDGPGQTFRGERQPDGVEPEGGNLIHSLIERNLPQTVRSAIRRLHPEPVDRLDREILT